MALCNPKVRSMSAPNHLESLDVPVLKGINLSIESGEYVAIMGASGSGKSTLMNIIGCLDRPSSGQYFLAGQDLTKLDDDELADIRNQYIGFVFQQFNLLPRLTSLSNVMLPMIYADVDKSQRIEQATKLRQQPGLTALWGIGGIFAILFGTVFLAVTLIGIPLIPLLSLSAVVTSLVGSLGVALFVGQRINRNDKQSATWQFLIGLAILTVLALIPVLGGLVVFLINLFGLGVILLWKFGRAEPQMVS